jgi:hypothetical protein
MNRSAAVPAPTCQMPASIDLHLLGVVAIVALVAWRVYSRIRRVVGRQRLSTARPWITVVVFPLLLVLVLAGSLPHPMTGLAVLAGAALGVGLGLYGIRLTRFEATPAGLFYTPNAHLGIALSMLLVLRLGYRFVLLQASGRPFDPQSMQMGTSPLTMAIFGTLAGYYVTYAIGLLRWRARVSSQPAAKD